MKRLIIFLFLILLIVSTYVIIFPLSNIDQVTVSQTAAQDYWPEDTWRTSTPEEQGMDSGMLADMINTIRESGKSVNSITIIRNGYLVNEAYFYPYQKGVKHAMNSCTKSVISALVGIAIHDGKIKSIDDEALDYFPGMEIANIDQRKQNIKIKDLMTMSAGIKWDFANNSSTIKSSKVRIGQDFILTCQWRRNPAALLTIAMEPPMH